MPLFSRPWPFRSKAPQDDARFGFAVVGLGHGAIKFLEALRSSPSVRVSALVSGDSHKANRLAHSFHVPSTYTYAEMDRLIDDPAVQAVYLCVPNALHREFTERAARAGKHILCEKPMAATVNDCHAMITACRAADRLLMIGYRTQFSSVHEHARALIQSGVLGQVQTVRSGFGFHAKAGWRLDPKLAGGGSLYDVGVYPIHSLQHLLGEPFTIDRASLLPDPQTGLEMTASWQGTLKSGATITFQSSYLEKIPDFFEVQAERATLLLKPAFAYEGLHLQVRARDRSHRRELDRNFRTPRNEPSTFRLEAEHLAHCVNTGAEVLTPGASGLRDMQIIQAIETAASR
ncbi:MAG: Gfo/Idh/MocA family protein [Janthinobacterium lividum]